MTATFIFKNCHANHFALNSSLMMTCNIVFFFRLECELNIKLSSTQTLQSAVVSDNILRSISSSLKKPTAATLWSFFLSFCWLVCPSSHWSNCNLPVQTQLHQWALITLHPPGYKDMHSCCSVAQKLNVISGIPPFQNRIVLQEALQTAKASKLVFLFQSEHYILFQCTFWSPFF